MKKEAPSLEHALMARILARTLDWDFTVFHWGDAVVMDGLLDAAELLEDDQAFDFVAGFYRRWSKRGSSWADHLVPGLALLRIYGKTGEKSLLDRAVALAGWLESVPHARRSGAPLYRPDVPANRYNVWIDSIYHEPSFYCELARITGDHRYHDRALDIWFSHVRALSGPIGPFLAHSCDGCAGSLKGYGWARGQGWALYGMIDTLQRLPRSHARWDEAVNAMRDFAALILARQDDSGLWHTLIHDDESYLESSTAAFFGGAFLRGMRLGLLDATFKPAADKAWLAVVPRIRPSGEFRGVSAWTIAGATQEDDILMYKTLPTEFNWWGQGCALRFCAERIRSELQTQP